MDLIALPANPITPAAERIAADMLGHLNSELSRRVEHHAACYHQFWESPEATPDSILAAMGPLASILLASAGESVEHIATLAAFAGKSLTDFLPAEQWSPRRAFITAEDGTVTLAPPADGFDAWGNLIPQAEPAEV